MATATEYLPAVRVMLVSVATSVPMMNVVPVDAAIEAARQLIGDADRENIIALLVNYRGRVTAVHTVAIGSLTNAPFDVAALFRAAILANADGFILAHNHPSGDATFSYEDHASWRMVAEAGKLLGIKAIDFVVVTPGRGPVASMFLAGKTAERARQEAVDARYAEEHVRRQAILCRSDEERDAFVAAITSGAGPGDCVVRAGKGNRRYTFQELARRLYSALLPLPEPARLVLGLPEGANFAGTARILLRRWKTEGSNHEPRDGGVAQA